MKKSIILAAALLSILASSVLAQDSTPKPTIEQLQKQVQFLQVMLDGYRNRAIAAEDQVMQLQAQKMIDAKDSKAKKGS